MGMLVLEVNILKENKSQTKKTRLLSNVRNSGKVNHISSPSYSYHYILYP